MNTNLLNRSLGALTPLTWARVESGRLLHVLESTNTQFTGSFDIYKANYGERAGTNDVAHSSGVNALAIDKFEGRFLISGGADSSISLWDLETSLIQEKPSNHPIGTIVRTSSKHKFGVTHLSFYPFDSLAFLSSSYDHTLKIYSSETLTASANFDLASVVYSHSQSPIASHLLVACATQQPAVRLVDLRSGASTHSLAGHSGAVLSVGWSPTDEYILASGGVDGTVKFWDIRRSTGALCGLDMGNSLGINDCSQSGINIHNRHHGKAHSGPVNGVVWTDNGSHIVTVGHDEKVHIWCAHTGANTLVNFGPMIKNSHLGTLLPLITPSSLLGPRKEAMFFPGEKEILVYELFEGTLLKRLRTISPVSSTGSSIGQQAHRNTRNRTTTLAWRAHSIELFSGHADGKIKSWAPRAVELTRLNESLEEIEETEKRKRKREALEDVYRDLTKQHIAFE